MVASVSFLTPTAALVGLAFLLPLALWFQSSRRVARARRAVGLSAPRRWRRLLHPLALLAIAALVAAAAAQPSVRTTGNERARTDAEMIIVFDVSRSMLARPFPVARTRLQRSRIAAESLYNSFRRVPTGVASLTNRMMPLLFPIASPAAVKVVISRAVGIEQPPPTRARSARATTLSALDLAADTRYFDPTAKKRALVVLTDGDSDPFSVAGLLSKLRNKQIEPFVLRIAQPNELVFNRFGQSSSYDPSTNIPISEMRAAGWHVYAENDLEALKADLASYFGSGPTESVTPTTRQQSMAPLLAAAALALTLALVLPSLLSALAGFATVVLRRDRR